MADNTVLASISASNWLADSAATTHIVQQHTDFESYTPETSDIEGITPGASLRTYGHGNVPVKFKVKESLRISSGRNLRTAQLGLGSY